MYCYLKATFFLGSENLVFTADRKQVACICKISQVWVEKKLYVGTVYYDNEIIKAPQVIDCVVRNAGYKRDTVEYILCAETSEGVVCGLNAVRHLGDNGNAAALRAYMAYTSDLTTSEKLRYPTQFFPETEI